MRISPVEEIHEKISNFLGRLAKNWNQPVKITLLVRVPGLNDGDLVVTDDDLRFAITALQKRLAAQREIEINKERSTME